MLIRGDGKGGGASEDPPASGMRAKHRVRSLGRNTVGGGGQPVPAGALVKNQDVGAVAHEGMTRRPGWFCWQKQRDPGTKT